MHEQTVESDPVHEVEPGRTPGGSSSEPVGGSHLIHSKLKPPLTTSACVQRKELLARLDSASHRKLCLLAAPIGAGKTTLLTQWHRHASATRAIAWLSLDQQDNAPSRFFSYLIGAVRSVVPAFDAYVAGRRDEDPRLVESTTAMLNERLDALTEELVIVIDDFQWLTSPLLARSFDLLLRRSPPTVHWIVSGRCLPDLSLGSLRLSDQLTMFGADDLRFDSALIVELSRKLCRRALSLQEAEYIRERTEGWVAGAKLALLAREDPRAADDGLHAFAGSHVEVARYLGETVLDEQPPAMREFLLASSLVERMTGELCDALLGIEDSQRRLEHLERAQLFIQPLDGHRCWYRYHTLFRDFLVARLRRDRPASIPVLHERASRWYAEHQLFDEALEHAFAARDEQWRNELLGRCAAEWLQSGEVASVLSWSERLSKREIVADAATCRSYVAALILSRRFEDAEHMLRQFRAVASQDPLGAVHVRLLTMMYAILTDQDGELAFDDVEALRTSGVDAFLSGTLLTLQAYVLLRRNQFDAARRTALRARDVLKDISVYGLGYADAVASLADRAQGDVKAATERCEQMFAAVRNGPRNPAWVNAAIALATVRYEENRLAEAESLCVDVLPLLSIASTVENCTAAYVTLARTKAIAKRAQEAGRLLEHLHAMLDGGAHRRFVAQVWGEKIRLALLERNHERAWALAREYGLDERAEVGEWLVPRDYDESWERAGSAYAMLLAHCARYGEAQRILTVLRDSAHAAGYVFREIRLEALLASCCWRGGDCASAYDALNRGLALTRGYGFTRGVFDEAPGLAQVLKTAIERRKLRHVLSQRYLRKLQDVCAGRASAPAASGFQGKAPLPLEPLTDREIEILRLLARGFSNSQISEHSQIALSTAKWHLKNVFAKLDVSTRTGALARARELRLID